MAHCRALRISVKGEYYRLGYLQAPTIVPTDVPDTIYIGHALWFNPWFNQQTNVSKLLASKNHALKMFREVGAPKPQKRAIFEVLKAES